MARATRRVRSVSSTALDSVVSRMLRSKNIWVNYRRVEAGLPAEQLDNLPIHEKLIIMLGTKHFGGFKPCSKFDAT